MPHIFISYAKKDSRKLALVLAAALNALDGVTAWVDRSLRAGRSWELQIQAQIDRCDTMIVLYSPDINRHKNGESESYVLTEIAYAKWTAKKPIIPVMAQRTDPPISLTMEHYIDYTIEGLTLDDLVAALCDEMEIAVKLAADPLPASPVYGGGDVPMEAPSQPKPKQPADPAAAVERARRVTITRNADWTPVIETFTVHGIAFEMCLVPPGSFMMGSEDGHDDEKPVHKQTISAPYWIGLHPVTNAQWRAAVSASGGAVKVPEVADWYKDKSKDEHPVVGVTWYQCRDFVQWLGETWYLPTEIEWEYAARGPDARVYPWGNTFEPDLLVYNENPNRSTAAVGGRPDGASWVGAQDMAGNVWDWCLTQWQNQFVDPLEEDVFGASRLMKGGSFKGNLTNTRLSYYSSRSQEFTAENKIGLRLCFALV